MSVHESRRVGHVSVGFLRSARDDAWSDGPDEQVLLEAYSSDDPDAAAGRLLTADCPWPIRYHVSPGRRALLDWFPFDPGHRVLEIGAGCGALTGVLTRSAGWVSAVELTPRRALITAHRHRSAENLEVFVGHFTDLPQAEPYDVVTCIGVLEYAGTYGPEAHAHLDFLRAIRRMLTADGVLIVAIENRLGLKYWTGASEDHSGLLFDSLEGYPAGGAARTFGRKELAELLRQAGFASQLWYYPVPDYKFPSQIFSDAILPMSDGPVPASDLPSPSPDQPRMHLFSEPLAFRSVVENGLFPEFANSFLVVARREPTMEPSAP